VSVIGLAARSISKAAVPLVFGTVTAAVTGAVYAVLLTHQSLTEFSSAAAQRDGVLIALILERVISGADDPAVRMIRAGHRRTHRARNRLRVRRSSSY
jgi:hypothetical protein